MDTNCAESRANAPCDMRMGEACEPGLASVIIPTYNRARLLVEAMDSVLIQTYRPIEMIVVDDGSTDDTDRLAAQWGARCAQDAHFSFRYLRQDNTGAQVARNRGLAESHGEFIQFLDSDDVLFAEKVARQVACLNAYRTADVAYGDWVEGCDPDTATLGSLGPQGDMVVALLSNGWLPAFCYLCRRRATAAADGWDPAIQMSQDFDYFMRLACAESQFLHVPVSCGLYRQYAGERISRQSDDLRRESVVRILRRVEELLARSNSLAGARAWALAHFYLVFARERCAANPAFLTWALGEVRRICPGFKPRNARYRFLVSVLGYSRTQYVVNCGRLVRERLGL